MTRFAALLTVLAVGCTEQIPPVEERKPSESTSDLPPRPAVDYACSVDADCVPTDIGNCCSYRDDLSKRGALGYFPACTSATYKLDYGALFDWCVQNNPPSSCLFSEVDHCSCVDGKCVTTPVAGTCTRESLAAEGLGEIPRLAGCPDPDWLVALACGRYSGFAGGWHGSETFWPGRPAAITEFERDGAQVFYARWACCDAFNPAFDGCGNYLCTPDGGIAGRGDGSCPDYLSTATRTGEIWRRTSGY